MKSLIILASKGISIDKFNNNATIYNIIERISSDSFPIFFPEMYFFILLEKKEDEERSINCILKIYNNKKEIKSVEVKPKFENSNHNRTVINISGLTIFSPGKLLFKFIYDGRTLGIYSILLIKTSAIKSKVIESI